ASAAAPSLLSTSYGTQAAVRLINSRIKGKISVDKVKLGWVGSQKVENFKYVNTKGATIFSCHTLQTNTPLVYLAIRKNTLKNIFAEEPYLKIAATAEDAEKKNEKANRAKKGNKKNFCLPQLKGTVLVTGGTIELGSDSLSAVTVTDIFISK